MRFSKWITGFALVLSLVCPLTALAASPTQPPRWVQADDVRVRANPSLDAKIIGSLPRGAELILKAPGEIAGFCFIEGEGQYGYVACRYLSANPVARSKAGEGGVPAEQRWVSGNGVTLREAPSPTAAVVGRMSLNAVVKLLRAEASGGYCEVQPASGPSGYTACRYLVLTPVVLAHIQGVTYGDQAGPADYDPERAFALQPGWNALEQYANFLKSRHPELATQGSWPRDDALERMKAHLALGIVGPKPAPYADWSDLKRKAAQDLDLTGEAHRLQAQHKTVPQEVWQKETRTQQIASELQSAIGIWGALHDAISGDGGAVHVIRLIRALEFPTVGPSLFKKESDLAPPGANAEDASGRFGIVFRQLVTARPKPKAGDENPSSAGLYDMLARTQALVRSVRRVQIMRDGRLRVEPSVLRSTETLWRDVDEPMCAGWAPGFSYGDSDPAIWRYFGDDAAMASLNPARKGDAAANVGLYAVYTSIDMPRATAVHTETSMKMDSVATGFMRGVTLYYDLDGDGIADLAVWEGQGKGPGHLEGTTTTDDRWYRLALVNINGAWKVLGSDIFGYGCGC